MTDEHRPNERREAHEIRVQYVEGGTQIHEKAIVMLSARLREQYPDAQREERYLSRYHSSFDVEVRYPFQGHLVLDFLAAPHAENVWVWDLWPAEESFPEGLSVLDLLDPRAPDLASRYGRSPLPGNASIRPMTLYFPRSNNGLGGYWLSIFQASDAGPYLRPGSPPLRDESGIVYYQELFEASEPPFRVDNLIPAPLEVSAPLVHPDPAASRATSLFPAPQRVPAPGVLPGKTD